MSMRQILVTEITWDTEGETVDNIPTQIELTIPENLNTYEDIEEYVSNEISNKTGYCHLGYSTTPGIDTFVLIEE